MKSQDLWTFLFVFATTALGQAPGGLSGALGQDEKPAERSASDRRGSADGLADLEHKAGSAALAADVLLTTDGQPWTAAAKQRMSEALTALRPLVESNPEDVLPYLHQLEAQFLKAFAEEGEATPEALQALREVVALREAALGNPGPSRAVGLGRSVRATAGPGSRSVTRQRVAGKLSERYEETRTLLVRRDIQGKDLLVALVRLDLRMARFEAQSSGAAPEREAVSAELAKGRKLLQELSHTLYEHYRPRIESEPAEVMAELARFLHKAPRRAKRARRQGGLLLSEARRVWRQGVFGLPAEQRLAELRRIEGVWRAAIRRAENHPLSPDLESLRGALAALEGGQG